MRSDIVVIGGGLAGITAAMRAASLGREVTVIRKAYGATAVGCGAFDVLGTHGGDLLHSAFDLRKGAQYAPPHDLFRLITRRPAHPYALFVEQDEGSEKAVWKSFRPRFDVAASFILDRLAKAGYELEGSAEAITPHPTAMGTLRWTNFAPVSIHRGNVNGWRKGGVVFVGIDGVDTFDTAFASRSLSALLAEQGSADAGSFDARTVTLPWGRKQGGMTPAEVARELDDPERRESFVAAVESELAGQDADHLVMAPVLGIDSHAETLHLLEKRTGARVCEPIIPAPHAIHGLRLQKALDRALESAGVRLVQAHVAGFDAAGSVIRMLRGEGDDGPFEAEARRFVLATGRFFGGGLVSQNGMRETVFNLPIYHGGRPVRERPPFALLRERYWSRQPAFEAGLRAGRDLRPVDGTGRVAYANLHAAGSILGGFDLAADGTGQGVDALTGYEAGSLAAKDVQA
ncbi:MAG: FAD-binding protein [Deltaproteobacteria bacterium]|nr:FAD-binding protein [Deltaproteobacteria bacterium]